MLQMGRTRARTRALAIAGAAIACFAVCGVIAGSAFAAAAKTLPAQDLGPVAPFTDQNGNPVPLVGSGTPIKVKGLCPTSVDWIAFDPIAFVFSSGNAVGYRPIPSPPPGAFPFYGGNVEGQANLVDLNTGPSEYWGHAHLWFGINPNPTGNSQFYTGETVSFSSTAPDGTSISISGNPGFVISASGRPSGWGAVTITCSGFSS